LNVIPDEDSQREVEAATDQPEDDYSGLMEDGLGGGGGDGDDFIDDERNDAGANTQDRFALPPWLSVAFKAWLEEANIRGGDGDTLAVYISMKIINI